MKFTQRISILLLFLAIAGTVSAAAESKIKYVNPMVGTDFNGHTFPGATVPFGMVQLSPDTRLDTWHGCSGYHYSDHYIFGFSHTHLSGTGCQDYGDILFMPVTRYTDPEISNQSYGSEFSHEEEFASAGYYQVFLKKYGIRASFTAGPRTGVHKYEYQKGDAAQLVIDLEHRDELLAHSLEQVDRYTIKGHRRSAAWAREQDVYFYTVFSRAIEKIEMNTDRTKAVITFKGKKKGNTLLAKVALSSVSTDNARLNLESEMPGRKIDFDKQKEVAEGMWNDFLGKIDVETQNEENLNIFYTAMYHCAIAPNLYSDINGQYRGMDRKIHQSEAGRTQYTVFSLWDTFRALHPFFTIIEPERTEDFLYSFYSIYAEAGKLPVWELGRCETNCMIGYNSVSVIADALIKGILNIPMEGKGFTVASLLDAMISSANKKEFGIDVMRKYGAVLADKEHESVSKTLEYAYDDWCIAQVAGYLYEATQDDKYAEIRDEYLKYALNYRNVFDPSTGFMRPRLNGRWLSPFNPREVNNHYTEANSWQYSFFVPQDIEGHIALLGGDEAFCAKIDSLYSADERTAGRKQVDITGLIGQYAHGNEPSQHIAYLYPYAGQAWKTQETARKIMLSQYSSSADGLCGNDDCGQMSAWYVMSALGFYSVTPGSTDYIFGSPLFSKATIHLSEDKDFIISVSDEDLTYIDSITYTDASGRKSPYTQSYFTHEQLRQGGRFDIRTARTPNRDFARAEHDRPHNAILTEAAANFVVNPWFEMENDVFKVSMEVSIGSADPDAEIYYRVKNPARGKDCRNMKFNRYTGPFSVYDHVILEAYAMKDGKKSYVTECIVHRILNDYSIQTLVNYNPQYDAGGDEGLINGVRGNLNWKAGGWQGFQGCDFDAIVDLKAETSISQIGAGFLQDIRSWIWMPVEVEFLTSLDGEHFTSAGSVKCSTSDNDYTIQIDDYILNLKESIQARYIRVVAKNYGIIPSWHLGAGGQTFIFIDEIWINGK